MKTLLIAFLGLSGYILLGIATLVLYIWTQYRNGHRELLRYNDVDEKN